MTLRDALIRDEGGMRLRPYPDSVGKLTIGVGRNLTDKGISPAEGELMFENDIREAGADVAARIPWSSQIDDTRRAVLIMLAFNMGIGGLLAFRKMLAAMGRSAWAEAARELLDSTYAEQVGPRAHRLAQQLETGAWV